MPHKHRRASEDRRQEVTCVTFPLHCADHSIVLTDRRVRCERRIGSLEVTEAQMSQEEFMQMFEYSDSATNTQPESAQKNIEGIDIFDNCLIND